MWAWNQKPGGPCWTSHWVLLVGVDSRSKITVPGAHGKAEWQGSSRQGKGALCLHEGGSSHT